MIFQAVNFSLDTNPGRHISSYKLIGLSLQPKTRNITLLTLFVIKLRSPTSQGGQQLKEVLKSKLFGLKIAKRQTNLIDISGRQFKLLIN